MTPQIESVESGHFLTVVSIIFQFTVKRSDYFTSGVFPVLYEKVRYPIWSLFDTRDKNLYRHNLLKAII